MYKYILVFITLFFVSFQFYSQTKIDPNGFNTFYYPNGEKSSEGNFVNGKPEGFWKNYYETGILKSEGNRKNHELDSIWLFYYENGFLKERINYTHSKREGYSKFYSEEGFLLKELPYKNDTIQGVAHQYFSDLKRVQFDKPYQENVLNGKGYEYDRDGRVINIINYEKGVVKSMQPLNRYDRNNKKTGLWITYHDLPKVEKVKLLEGRYKNDLKNGYFREYDKNGIQVSTTKYINGEVVENAEELMNVDIRREFFPDASVKWEKSYLGSLEHGVWKEFDTSGVVIQTLVYNRGIILGEGVIDVEGIKQGHWKEYYSTGELRAEGDYEDGAKIGTWKFFHTDQKLEQVGKYRKGGRPHGDWVWYYPNGEVRREETYLNGKEEGNIIEYSETGEVLKQGSYIDGLEEGNWEFNTGDYIEKGAYTEGMMQGEWIGIYKSNNKTAFKGNYIEGEPNGKHIYYYASGKKMLEGEYQMGLKIKDWKRYDESGVLQLTIEYKDGVAVKLNGKKVSSKDN